MNKKYLAGLSLLFLLTILVGCIPLPKNTVHISGYVEDKYGNRIAGIRVTYEGVSDVTDRTGEFGFLVRNVEYAQNVQLNFTGSDLGFEPLNQKVWITPGANSSLGRITLQRNKALVKGSVTLPPFSSGPYIQTLGASPVQAATVAGPAYPAGEIIVKFKEGLQTLAVEENINTQLGLQVLSKHPSKSFITYKTTGDLQETIANLEARSDVEFAEPNYYVYPASYSAPDPERPRDSTWNIEAVNAPNARNYAYNSYNYNYYGSDIYVAVLDTGIKPGIIPDSNILWELGKDYVDHDNDPQVTYNSHGTQVADIIYQVTQGNVSIIPIRILDSTYNDGARGTLSQLLLGLEYALNNADIINLSVAIKATASEIRSVEDLLWSFEQQGKLKLIIGAAGNDGLSEPAAPANSHYILSVGAVGPTLQPASYTNRGAELYAPGGDYNLYPIGVGNTIQTAGEWAEGTSIASAHVAGVAAIVLAENPSLRADDLRHRLTDHALIWSYTDGGKLVDALGAVMDADPQRPLVFFEHNEEPAESSFIQPRTGLAYDGLNYFEIAAVEPGYRLIQAWVDKDMNGRISSGDYYAQQNLSINKGDIIEDIELNLEVY